MIKINTICPLFAQNIASLSWNPRSEIVVQSVKELKANIGYETVFSISVKLDNYRYKTYNLFIQISTALKKLPKLMSYKSLDKKIDSLQTITNPTFICWIK